MDDHRQRQRLRLSDISAWTAYRNVLIQGSATSYTPPVGFSVTEPFQLTVTNTSHSVENGKCWQEVTDDNSNNSGAVETALTLAGHDAQVTLDASGPPPGVLAVGEPMPFTVAYSNLGNQFAPTSTLSLTLGAGLHFVDAQPPAAQAAADAPISWDLGDLPVDAEGTIAVHAQTESAPETGNLTFVELDSAGYDIAPANYVTYDGREQLQTPFTGIPRVYVPLLGR